MHKLKSGHRISKLKSRPSEFEAGVPTAHYDIRFHVWGEVCNRVTQRGSVREELMKAS
jgi:hypothetical protein